MLRRFVLLAVCGISLALAAQTIPSRAAASQPTPAALPTPASQTPVRSLGDVHTIFIAPMDYHLDDYIVAELFRRLPKGVTMAENRADADSILQGVVNPAIGKGESLSSAVQLVSTSGEILWADEKSDHTSAFPRFRQHGLPTVATRIAKDLSKSLKVAAKGR